MNQVNKSKHLLPHTILPRFSCQSLKFLLKNDQRRGESGRELQRKSRRETKRDLEEVCEKEIKRVGWGGEVRNSRCLRIHTHYLILYSTVGTLLMQLSFAFGQRYGSSLRKTRTYTLEMDIKKEVSNIPAYRVMDEEGVVLKKDYQSKVFAHAQYEINHTYFCYTL